MVYRLYVEKKPGFDVEANGLKNELTSLLGIKDLTGLRLLNRYDVEGIDEALFNQCVSTVFSEPPVDNTYAELPAAEGVSFAVEYLPGQFDQRAASAAECIQLISQGERPLVRSARVYLLEGALTPRAGGRDQEVCHQPCGSPRGFSGDQRDPEDGLPRARCRGSAGGLQPAG